MTTTPSWRPARPGVSPVRTGPRRPLGRRGGPDPQHRQGGRRRQQQQRPRRCHLQPGLRGDHPRRGRSDDHQERGRLLGGPRRHRHLHLQRHLRSRDRRFAGPEHPRLRLPVRQRARYGAATTTTLSWSPARPGSSAARSRSPHHTAGEEDPILNTASVTGDDLDDDAVTPDSSNQVSVEITHDAGVLTITKSADVCLGGPRRHRHLHLQRHLRAGGRRFPGPEHPRLRPPVRRRPCGVPTNSGDDGDALLESGETWVFSCTFSVPAHTAGGRTRSSTRPA